MEERAIRKTNDGWAAVKIVHRQVAGSAKSEDRARLIMAYTGQGSKAKAIQTAGTNRVIA